MTVQLRPAVLPVDGALDWLTSLRLHIQLAFTADRTLLTGVRNVLNFNVDTVPAENNGRFFLSLSIRTPLIWRQLPVENVKHTTLNSQTLLNHRKLTCNNDS